jgi:hypothetical protein
MRVAAGVVGLLREEGLMRDPDGRYRAQPQPALAR